MSDIKCPFCNQPLHDDHDGYYSCYSDNCCVSGGTLDTWQELDRWKQSAEDHQNWLRLAEKRLERTRKALDVAKNAINSAADHNIINCVARGIDPRTDDVSVTLCNALEQITTLEQKD